MCKHLLLVAALSAVAILPASAHGHGPVPPNVVSSLNFRIILRDTPKVVHHHHQPRRYIKPQPWPLKFKQYALVPRWQQPRHHHTRHFQGRNRDHRQQFKDGHRKRWGHAPADRAKLKHREYHYGSRRHH